MIKNTWKTLKLGEMCEIGRGSSPRPIADQKYFINGNIPWVKIADATKSGKYLYETKEKVNEYGASFSRLLPKGSLIMATSGTLGYAQFLGIDACIHDGWLYIKNFCGLNANFLYYYLQFNRDYFYKNAYGSAIQNVNTDILRKMEICLPTEKTQQKIASIISAYDDLIENNNNRIKKLEKATESIYENYFMKDDSSFTEYKLSDLVSTQYGYTESAKNEVVGPHYLRGTDINKKSYIVWDEVPYCPISESDYKKYKLEIKDILIIRMADPGKIGIVEKEIDAVFASYLIRLRIVKNIISPYYLFYFLNSDKYQNYINGASNGTTRQSASAKVITDIKIPVPDIDLLNSFEEKVGKIRELISNLVDKNEMLTKAKNLLLPKLISGELDVEGLDIKIRPEIL